MRFSEIFVFVIFCVCVKGQISNRDDAFELAKKGLTEYLETGQKPSYLDWVFRHFQFPGLFRSTTDPSEFAGNQVCTICELVINILIQERKLGMTDIQLAAEASYFCSILNIESERVCDGAIDLNVGIVTYIIDTNGKVNGKKVCGLLLQSSGCDQGNNFDWTVEVPKGKTITKVKSNETSSFNILHLSDFHYDPLYTPGKSTNCGEPLCCQVDQADATDETDSCGHWSNYKKSDVPLHTIVSVLEQVDNHDYDYVYFTGDVISHRVWSTSIANNTVDITTIVDALRDHFSVPVFPILGNHEPHPLNAWSPDGESDAFISTEWLFKLVAEKWSKWLPEDAKTTILKGGYYTVVPKKGFRVIALNSNVCYVMNWWLLASDNDPYGQLAWLAATLQEAEKNSESVHILSHIPTGHGGCLRVWAREYAKIVERFANTITGQFNGHTHRDEFSLYYSSSDPTKAISVAWNGASVVPYENANPSYKLYQIAADTFDVLDFEEYTFNLTAANLAPTKDLEWSKLYSFKEAYGVESLQPSAIDELVQKMTKDHSLIQQYYRYKVRNGDVAISVPCDESCEKGILCSITTTVYNTTEACKRMQQLYDDNNN